jgi:hypothetical protein
MGLRYRGRSKGKDMWVNWSWSKKNGLGVSASVKAGPFTWNSGNGKSTQKRITTNLPGGFYHVTSNSKPSSSSRTERQPQAQESQSKPFGLPQVITLIAICIGILLLFRPGV